jgi:hypothetical protein
MLVRRYFTLLRFFSRLGALAARTRWLGLLLLGGLLASARTAAAQADPPAGRVRVSGTVSDAGTKRLLAGIAVRVRRTRQGVVSTAQGAFLLTASPSDTLLFQALGYKPYRLLVPGTSRSPFVVHIHLHRDSIRLHEVHVTAERVDRARVNRALRNLNRPVPPLVKGAQRPPLPEPLFAVDSTPPPPPPFGGGPIGLIYAKFSRAGKERHKMDQLKAKAGHQQAHQRVVNYNKAFKDNRGYE